MNDLTSLTLLDRLGGEALSDDWLRFDRVYGELVRRWLVQQGVAANDADDLRQEVMTVVIKELPRFDHSGRTGAFRNWLRKVTANRAHEFWRKRDRQKATPAGSHLGWISEQLADPVSPLSLIWNREHDRYLVERLLESVSGRFTPRSLLAFRRVVLEQQNLHEVAEEMDITANAIRVAQSRILRALRDAGIDAIL